MNEVDDIFLSLSRLSLAAVPLRKMRFYTTERRAFSSSSSCVSHFFVDTEVRYKTIVGEIENFTLTVYLKKINKSRRNNEENSEDSLSFQLSFQPQWSCQRARVERVEREERIDRRVSGLV